MDHIMIDVTGLNVKIGDQVVLIGSQGKETLLAADWAKWASGACRRPGSVKPE
jgi:alanine racemase